MNASDDDLTRKARDLFDAQAGALDGPTETTLRARRRDALASAARSRHSRWWLPASGIATAALAVVLWMPRADGPMPDDDDATDAARFAETALVELEDDAEFYAWLATVPDDTLETDTTALPEPGPQEGWPL